MKGYTLLNLFLKLNALITVIVVILLFYSVIRSGLFYEYDIDELNHTQNAYLIGNGYKPYTSFHMIFTPLFYWFQMPVYKTGGFNFDSIARMRIVMMTLFILRLFILFFLIKKIFGKLIALLFIPLLLLDPFSTFSASQIRPDNLMMVIFSLGMLTLSIALEKLSRPLFFLSGALFSLSFAVLIKILPGIAILIWIFTIYCYLKKSWKNFLFFLLGFPVPWVFLFLYFFLQGNLTDFLQNVFIFAFLNNISVLNSTPLSFFYSRTNLILFGTSDMQLPWVYVHFLPVLTIGGVLITAYPILCLRKRISYPEFLKIALIGLLSIFALWVLTIPGVYVQYFLPLSWIMALFASVFLFTFFTWVRKKSLIGFVFTMLLCLTLFVLLTKDTIEVNSARAEMTSEKIIEYNTSQWMVIPPGEATFPNMLFRPIGYPLVYGAFIGDTNPYVLKRWGKVEDYLKKRNVKYIFKNTYLWQHLSPSTRDYIDRNYQPFKEDGLLIKKS